MEGINLIIDKRNMNASIELIKIDDKAKFLNYEEILDKIEEKIKFGLDKFKLKDIIENHVYGKTICIAKGKEPINGEDGYLKYKFNIKNKLKPSMLNNGKVDFRDLGFFDNVKKGQILAEIIRPSKGQDGVNILGEKVSSLSGKEAKIKLGKNAVKFEEKIVSKIDGQVKLTNGKIEVLNTYTINSDINNETGNIEYNGTLKIMGSINPDFKVKTLGDIYIGGVVEDSKIESEGDIYISKGITGKNKTFLQTEGKLVTKYIENSTVIAKNDILSDDILHSKVHSHGSIIVDGRKGLIVGGECKAELSIQAKVVGSYMGTYTLLEIGNNPKIKEELELIKDKINSVDNNIEQILKSINLLKKKYKNNNLSPKKMNLFKQLLNTYPTLKDQKEKLVNKYNLKKDKSNSLSEGSIKIIDRIYPRTKIIIGNYEMNIKNIIKNSEFLVKDGEIKVSKL
ncbi:DUF342 domain-containing protein [Senegalia massiliensis]|uniref:DUF342 domain-containing protein n=1 Tax=Senegalia massiliensis TaxID=1720316 RepID=A0A845QZH9_9CLOT|nr:FapA family protein [Senegalia massiliensis]NBI07885.1 DUF342 domain-containing protein [Senegalia massiliensis]